MDHIHFLTDLELTAEEKKSILNAHMLRLAMNNRADSKHTIAAELVRVERMVFDRSILRLVPVDDQAVIEKRRFGQSRDIAGQSGR